MTPIIPDRAFYAGIRSLQWATGPDRRLLPVGWAFSAKNHTTSDVTAEITAANIVVWLAVRGWLMIPIVACWRLWRERKAIRRLRTLPNERTNKRVMPRRSGIRLRGWRKKPLSPHA